MSYKEAPDDLDTSPTGREPSRPDPDQPVADDTQYRQLKQLLDTALGARLHDIFPQIYPDRDAGVAALREEIKRWATPS